MRFTKIVLLAVFVALCLGPTTAQTQTLSLNLIPSIQNGNAGDLLAFSGTLQNLTDAELFLNGDSLSLNGTGLTPDDSPFFFNAPLSLMPQGTAGDSFTGVLFDVSVGPLVQNGSHSGSFTVLGGTTDQDSIELATQPFTIRVGPAVTPEGSSMLLMSAGLIPTMALGLWRKYRQRRPV